MSRNALADLLLSGCFSATTPPRQNALQDIAFPPFNPLPKVEYEAVINLNGTTDHDCGCPTKLRHWCKLSGLAIPSYCSVEHCLRPTALGAHVLKENYLDRDWYLVPMCEVCNHKREVLRVPSYALIPARTSLLCGA